jgi:hypothetical protein
MMFDLEGEGPITVRPFEMARRVRIRSAYFLPPSAGSASTRSFTLDARCTKSSARCHYPVKQDVLYLRSEGVFKAGITRPFLLITRIPLPRQILGSIGLMHKGEDR